MAAQSIGIFTFQFPDPVVYGSDDVPSITLPANSSFRDPIVDGIQTLSTKNIQAGASPRGLLYVPVLTSDGCKSAEQQYVPSNVTRQANLPQKPDFDLIAIAPWFSSSCIQEYFASARIPAVRAMIVYQPGQGNVVPPQMNDPSWTLGDGGSWKVANTFPTYAISSTAAEIVVRQLGYYSGNISSAPNGDQFLSFPGAKSTDYVRLWASVNTENNNGLPSLWVFLVIVLGLLVVVLGCTSFTMHFVQRRRRNALRQRVINGQIDLEALGVKRLTVPQEYLDKLPSYAYVAGPESTAHPLPADTIVPQPASEPSHAETEKAVPLRSSSAPIPASVNNRASVANFSQTTCAICLDDFEANASQIRELPCRHIYHVECIDPFLLNNSSLCPVCKQSVLPTGLCPVVITNMMVRRERILSRTRGQAPTGSSGGATQASPFAAPLNRLPGAFGSVGSRFGSTWVGRRVFSAPQQNQQQAHDIELAAPNEAHSATMTTETAPVPVDVPSSQAPIQPPALSPEQADSTVVQNRRERARQRAIAMLGNREVPSATEDEGQNAPKWKRTLRRVFPGFR